MTVRMVVEDGPYDGVVRTDVIRSARAMLGAVQMGKSELSILLTGDDQIRILNGLYRGKNRPTDVLAFAQREGELGDRAGRLLGDVVISIPTARRQAEARGAELQEEVTMLLAHGLLHLLGWDHQTPSDDKRMRRETTRLCHLEAACHPQERLRTQVKGRTAPSANGNSRVRKAARTER